MTFRYFKYTEFTSNGARPAFRCSSTAGAVIAVAASYRTQITCPIDGAYMSFDISVPGQELRTCVDILMIGTTQMHASTSTTQHAPCATIHSGQVAAKMWKSGLWPP
jgi:hypothetical protein